MVYGLDGVGVSSQTPNILKKFWNINIILLIFQKLFEVHAVIEWGTS